MTKCLCVLALTVLAVAGSLSGQQSQLPTSPPRPVVSDAREPNASPTGVIRGRILTALGRPAARASVHIVGLAGGEDSATAEVDGRYEVSGLKPGLYRVTASKPGFFPLDFGQKRAFERGTPLVLADGQTLANIDITLPTAGAITGRISDENGDPIEGLMVMALQSRFSGGRRQLLPVSQIEPRPTDDRGMYRLFGIPPGSYIIIASPNNRPLLLPGKNHVGYVPTYFPGSAMPSDAQAVTMGLSQTITGVDFVEVLAKSARVSGAAFDSNNRPLGGTVALATTDRWGGLSVTMTTTVQSDGSFQFSRVPPGEYVVQAIGPRPPDLRGEGEFSATIISVNGQNIDGIELRTSAGSRVAGRLILEGDSRGVNFKDAVMVLAPMEIAKAPAHDMFLHRWRSDNDGTFQMTGLTGLRRLRLLSGPPSWTIKSVKAGGVDVTDEVLSFGTRAESIADLEVVLTNRAATLTGNVSDDRGGRVLDYTVVVFAIDARRWYPQSRFVKFARPTPDGMFQVTNLPAGDYYVAAVDWMQGDELSGEWQDPEFLETLSRGATRISLDEAQRATATPQLIVR